MEIDGAKVAGRPARRGDPYALGSVLKAHLASLKGPNPLGLVFPSKTGTPLYPKNIRRWHFLPALQALGIVGVRQHDFRRTFIALHVEAGTHPKLVQERVGHSSIGLTMDVYGRIAGQMAMATEQEARFEALAARALPAPVPVEPETNCETDTPIEPGGKQPMTPDPQFSGVGSRGTEQAHTDETSIGVVAGYDGLSLLSR